MGFFKSILGGAAPILGGFLGGPAGAAAGNVLGGFLSRGGNDAELNIGASPNYGNILGTIGAGALSRFGDRYMRERGAIRGLRLDQSFRRARMHEEWNFYRSQGLTPHEIKGIGGLGGAGGASGAGQVLGRAGEASAEAMLRVRENQLERESRERIARGDVAARIHATNTQAQTAAAAHGLNVRRFDDLELKRYDLLSEKQKQELNIALEKHNERWPVLLAKMGPDNVLIALQAAIRGIPIKSVLKGVKLSKEEWESVRFLTRDIISLKSKTAREILGWFGLLDPRNFTQYEDYSGVPSPNRPLMSGPNMSVSQRTRKEILKYKMSTPRQREKWKTVGLTSPAGLF